jgi:hypothetical protein
LFAAWATSGNSIKTPIVTMTVAQKRSRRSTSLYGIKLS